VTFGRSRTPLSFFSFFSQRVLLSPTAKILNCVFRNIPLQGTKICRTRLLVPRYFRRMGLHSIPVLCLRFFLASDLVATEGAGTLVFAFPPVIPREGGNFNLLFSLMIVPDYVSFSRRAAITLPFLCLLSRWGSKGGLLLDLDNAVL